MCRVILIISLQSCSTWFTRTKLVIKPLNRVVYRHIVWMGWNPSGCRWGSSLPSDGCVFFAVNCARSARAVSESLQQNGAVRKQRWVFYKDHTVEELFFRVFFVFVFCALFSPSSTTDAHRLELCWLFDQKGWKSLLHFRSCCAFLWRLIGSLWTLILPTLMMQSTTRIPVKLVQCVFTSSANLLIFCISGLFIYNMCVGPNPCKAIGW